MKLSADKRFGWIHVRGRRLLRVARDHQVSTGGRSEVESHGSPTYIGSGWTTAKVGDLVLEMERVKKTAFVGHSYLSGPAIQLNRYQYAPEEWFTPATIGLIVPPSPKAFDNEANFITALAVALYDARYAEHDLGAFNAVCANDEEARSAADWMKQLWRTAHDPAQEGKREHLPHLVAHIAGHKSVKKGVHINLHFQPSHDVADAAVTSFQNALLVGLAKRTHRAAAKKRANQ